MQVVAEACEHILQLKEAGWDVVITHGQLACLHSSNDNLCESRVWPTGNGPQVGALAVLNQVASEGAGARVPAMPLYVLGSETEGSIGWMTQNALRNKLVAAGKHDIEVNNNAASFAIESSLLELARLRRLSPTWLCRTRMRRSSGPPNQLVRAHKSIVVLTLHLAGMHLDAKQAEKAKAEGKTVKFEQCKGDVQSKRAVVTRCSEQAGAWWSLPRLRCARFRSLRTWIRLRSLKCPIARRRSRFARWRRAASARCSRLAALACLSSRISTAIKAWKAWYVPTIYLKISRAHPAAEGSGLGRHYHARSARVFVFVRAMTRV